MTTVEDLVANGLCREAAESILQAVRESHGDAEKQKQAWRLVSKSFLTPAHDFRLHQQLLRAVYKGWEPSKQGPVPAWIPTPEGMEDTNLAKFIAKFTGSKAWEAGKTGDLPQDYQLLQRISWQEPEIFWPQVLSHLRIKFCRQPSRMYQAARNPDRGKWLPGALLNIADCALHCRDPDAPAIVWAEEDSPASLHSLSLGQLSLRSQAVATALQRRGLQPGTAVAICMPMTVTAVAIYLGVVLAGCAVVGVADSFSSAEIAARLRISRAALLFTQDLILRDGKSHPLFERAVEKTAVPAIVVSAVVGRPVQVPLRANDLTWEAFSEAGGFQSKFRPHMAHADAVTNILFSSGTTGEPKAIPWTHVTPIRAATDAWAQQDVRQGDVVAFPTNLGWMMGPFLIYAALLNGASMALFHGAPLGRAFCTFVNSARVSILGVVPSIVRAWRRSDCIKGLDWGGIRCFSSTGEASSPEDCHWLMAQAGYKPVLELCGGTELGGAFVAGSLLQPQAPSTFSTPTLGSRMVILSGDGGAVQSAPESGEETLGELALVPPFLGCSQKLLNADHFKVYYEGMPIAEGGDVPLRRHGDMFERLPGGYYSAHGRSDDTMNLGGIKVSAVELERACVQDVAEVAEAAAVAVPEAGGGPDRLVLFLVPSGHSFSGAELGGIKLKCQKAIRNSINPLFKVDQVVAASSLPRTATNKVMRRILRARLTEKAKL